MIRLDDYIDFKLHDKIIDGIKVVDKTVILYIKSDIELRFIDALAIRVDNFKLGNIILNADIYEEKDLKDSEDDLLYLLNMSKSKKNKYYNNLRDNIRNKKLLFMEINTSYGLNGFILCKDVKIKI